MKTAIYLVIGGLVLWMAAVVPTAAQDEQWDFVYDGDTLPQALIDGGATDWTPREGETNGRPKYESILNEGVQVGGAWSRRDDNSDDPDAAGASGWARGYLFGTDVYDQWTGKMTLVVRIKDLGTTSQKSVIDLTNAAGENYWTLGHVIAGDDGVAGWEFGQTDDGRNGNGLSDVRTGASGQWAIVRITIADTTPGDGKSRIMAWQDGVMVYDAIRSDDLSVGEFGEIAFRRTSGGGEQHMAIDWVRMSFQDTWAPGNGPDTPNGSSDNAAWEFVYYGTKLPEDLITEGSPDWTAREGETNGSPSYETIVASGDAQIGTLWSRRDDNSDDPDNPDASSWARGYLFGSDIYDLWSGRMTLILRIKDLGTTSQKSVIDFTNASGDGYWTLGHVVEGSEGVAGWEFGQTNDGRNGNGTSDIRTGGYNQFVTIRITIQDDVPGDGYSLIKAWQDGVKVYESVRTDDISVGEFGEIAFRRTSGGGEQHMEIDWVLMKLGQVWEPGEGTSTPAGLFDGGGENVMNFPNPDLVNGAISLDTLGSMRTTHDPSQGAGFNTLFEVDENNVPTKLSIFYLGFDVYRDFEAVANDQSVLTGLLALDKYAGVHTFAVDEPEMDVSGAALEVTGPGRFVSGPGVPINGPEIDFAAAAIAYNANNTPGVTLPFFGGYDETGAFQGLDLDIIEITAFRGGDNAIARDIELAVDWRTATNAFQGYYLLDAFAGIHYINNPEVIAFLDLPANQDSLVTKLTDSTGEPVVKEPVGAGAFHDIFGFKPKYYQNYVGTSPEDDDMFARARAPYFIGLPVARDLEVMVRFQDVDSEMIADSEARNINAVNGGIDVDQLFQPIAMDSNRTDPTSPKYAMNVAITSGYAILDGFGGVHSLVEDKDGNAIPAPWESVETGLMHPDADAPYFFPLDLAVDIEILPNGAGYVLMTRQGEVFVVLAPGVTMDDSFTMTDMPDDLPIFGFDAVRDLNLVANSDGKVAGMYVVDRFGTIHSAGQVPQLPSSVLFFPNGYAIDLELSPLSAPVTSAQ